MAKNGCQRHPKNRSATLLKSVALLLIVFFTAEQIFPSWLWSQTSPFASDFYWESAFNNPRVQTFAVKLGLPEHLGRVDDFHQGWNGKQIYFIQDAHDSLEAQENIADIIQFLNKERGIRTVLEEGYQGPLPTREYFASISDAEVLRKTAYYFLDQLRLSAAEYLHALDPDAFKLIGVDHFRLYQKNLAAYRRSANAQDRICDDFQWIREDLHRLAEKKFTPEFRRWLKWKNLHDSRKLPLSDFVRRTMERWPPADAQKFPALRAVRDADFESLIKVKAENVFLELQAMERETATRLLKADDAALLYHYIQGLEFLNQLSRIEVPEPEYQAWRPALRELRTRAIAQFLADSRGGTAVLPKSWEKGIREALLFYDMARARERALHFGLSEFMNNSSEQEAILVFGGFHRAAIQESLKSLGYSYGILSPVISAGSSRHEQRYKKLMRERLDSMMPVDRSRIAARAPSIFLSRRGSEQVRDAAAVVAQLKSEADLPTLLFRVAEEMTRRRRSEMRGGDPAPFEELPSDVRDELLGRLTRAFPGLAAQFIKTIQIDGKAALYWTARLDSSARVVAETHDSRRVSYWAVSDLLKNDIEAALYSGKSPQDQGALDLLYLLLVASLGQSWNDKERGLGVQLPRSLQAVAWKKTAPASQSWIREFAASRKTEPGLAGLEFDFKDISEEPARRIVASPKERMRVIQKADARQAGLKDLLLAGLKDNVWKVRAAALQKISALKLNEFIPELMKMAEAERKKESLYWNGSTAQYQEILIALGRLGGKRVETFLRREMRKENWREAVLSGMSQVEGEAGTSLLVFAFKWIRSDYVYDNYLKSRADLKAKYYQLLWHNQINNAAELKGALGYAMEGLRHGGEWIRLRSAKVLEVLRHEKAVTGLVRALADEKVEVRASAADALKAIGTDEAMFYGYLYRGQVGEAAKVKGVRELVKAAERHKNEIVSRNALLVKRRISGRAETALKSADARERVEGLRMVSEKKGELAAREIRKALRDKAWEVRREALEKVVTLKLTGFIPELIKMAESERKKAENYSGGSEGQYKEILIALGHLGGKRVEAFLRKAMRKGVWREAVLSGMSQVEGEAGTSLLVYALQWVRNDYVYDNYLKSRADLKAKYYQLLWHDQINNAAELKGALGYATEGLSHGEEWIRLRSAKVLEVLRNERAVTGLVRALADKKAEMRASAADALKAIGTDEAMFYGYLYRGQVGEAAKVKGVRELVKAAERHKNEIVSRNALLVKRRISGRAETALKSADARERVEGLRMVSEKKGALAAGEIRKALRDTSWEVRREALEKVVTLKLTGFIPELMKMAESERKKAENYSGGSEGQYKEILIALGHLGGKRVEAFLRKEMRKEVWREAVLSGMSQVEGEAGTSLLVYALRWVRNDYVYDNYLKSRADLKAKYYQFLWHNQINSAAEIKGALGYAMEGLRHGGEWIRLRSAKVLEVLSHEKAVTGLVRALADEKAEMRASAADALKVIGTDEAMFYGYLYRGQVGEAAKVKGVRELVKAAEQHKNEMVRRNALLVKRRISGRAETALKSADARERVEGLRMVSEKKGELAAREIRKALRDKAWEVRREAVEKVVTLKLTGFISELIKMAESERKKAETFGGGHETQYKEIVIALGALGGKRVKTFLRREIRKEYWREAVLSGMSQVEGEAGTSLLVKAFRVVGNEYLIKNYLDARADDHAKFYRLLWHGQYDDIFILRKANQYAKEAIRTSSDDWIKDRSQIVLKKLARSEMRAKVEDFKKHAAYGAVENYYSWRSILIQSLVQGNAGAYEKAFTEMERYAIETLKKASEEEIRNLSQFYASQLQPKDLPVFYFDEISNFSVRELPKSARAVLEQAIGQYLEALGLQAKHRKDILRQIMLVVYPMSLRGILPRSIQDIRYKPEALKDLLKLYLEKFSNPSVGGFLLALPMLEADISLQLRWKGDVNRFTEVGLHEATHYLALTNILPFDVEREAITQAIGIYYQLQTKGVSGYLKFQSASEPAVTAAGKAKNLERKILETGIRSARKKQRPLTPEESERWLRKIIHKAAPDFFKLPEAVIRENLERIHGLYLAAYAHGLFPGKNKANGFSWIADYGRRYLPRVRHADLRRKITARDQAYIDQVLHQHLYPIARMMLASDTRLEPRTQRDLRSLDTTRWFYDEAARLLQYMPWDILEYGEDGAKGLTVQEVFRHMYSESSVIEAAYDVIPFRLLHGLAETARFVVKGLSAYPGRSEDIDAFYQKKLRIVDLEFEKERMAERPLFVQFIEGLFYALALSSDPSKPAEDPRITDEKVKLALLGTRLSPGAVRHVIDALSLDGLSFYEVMRDRVWPLAEPLLRKDQQSAIRDEVANQKLNDMIEKGEFEIDGLSPKDKGEAHSEGDRAEPPAPKGKEAKPNAKSPDKGKQPQAPKMPMPPMPGMPSQDDMPQEQPGQSGENSGDGQEGDEDRETPRSGQPVRAASGSPSRSSRKPPMPPQGEKLKINLDSEQSEGNIKPEDLSEAARKKLDEEVRKYMETMTAEERAEMEKRAREKLLEKLRQEAEDLAAITGEAPRESRSRAASKPKMGEKSGDFERDKANAAQALKAALEELKVQNQAVQERAQNVRESAGTAESKAEGVAGQTRKVGRGGRAPEGMGGDLKQSIKDLMDQLKALRGKSHDFAQAAERLAEKRKDIREGTQGPKTAKSEKLDDAADAIDESAGKISRKAAEADQIAENAEKSAVELAEALDKKGQEDRTTGTIKGRAEKIREDIEGIEKKLAEVQGEVDDAIHKADEIDETVRPEDLSEGEAAEAGEEEPEEALFPQIGTDEEAEDGTESGDPGIHFASRSAKDKKFQKVMARDKRGGSKSPKYHGNPDADKELRRLLAEELKDEAEDPEEREAEQLEAVRDFTGISDRRRVSYEKIRESVQDESYRMRENILNAIENARRTAWMHHQKRGQLKARGIVGAVSGERHPFSQKKDPAKKKIRIVVLVDGSGSMYQDGHNLDLDDVTPAMLKAVNRINNGVKTVVALMEAFRDNQDVEMEIGVFASNQKIVKRFKEPLDEGAVYEVVDGILNHDLGEENSDLAGLKKMLTSLRAWEAETNAHYPTLFVVIADGGINGNDADGIQSELKDNTDIVFIPRGIGPLSKDVKTAYAPFGKTEPSVNALAENIGEEIIEQSDRILEGTEAARSELRMVKAARPSVAALAKSDAFRSENFEVVGPADGERFLVLRNPEFRAKYPSFRVPINGEGFHIPKEEIEELKSNVNYLIQIIQGIHLQVVTKSPLLVTGEHGTGKNLMGYYAARLMRKNVRFMAFHDDITEDDLVERRGVNEKEEGKTDVVPSPLVEAMESGDLFFGDELSKAKPEVVAKILNIIEKREVRLRDGRVIRAKPGFAVVFFDNPFPGPRDVKIYKINKKSAEFLDRLSKVEVDYLPEEEEVELLYKRFMKKRGLRAAAEISDKERKIIRQVVKAANTIRDRYKGVDAAGGRPIGKGKLVRRPLSTRVLVRFTEHLAEFPEDISRARALIRRYYFYKNGSDKQIANVDAVFDNYDLLKTDRKISFTDEELKGPVYAVNKTGQRVLKLKDIEVPVGKNALKSLDEIRWDRRVKWTEGTLRYAYDMLQDFKLGNPFIVVGEAGTGKDLISEYLSIALYGPHIESVDVTNNQQVEDVIAYIGLGEGERMDGNGMLVAAHKYQTGIVKAAVARGMHRGVPTLFSEINKAKPEVNAALNNILQFRWTELANGWKLVAEAGFTAIGTQNPTWRREYLGNNEHSAEFEDRFSWHEFKELEKSEEQAILEDYNLNLRRFEGTQFKILKSEWIGRVVDMLRDLRQNWRDKKFGRFVSLRAGKRIIALVAAYPEIYDRPEELKLRLSQQIVTDNSEEDFPKIEKAAKDAKVGTERTGRIGDIVEYQLETGIREADQLISDLTKGNQPIVQMSKLDALFRLQSKSLKPETAAAVRDGIQHALRQSWVDALSSESGVLIRAMQDHLLEFLDGEDVSELPEVSAALKIEGDLELTAERGIGRDLLPSEIAGILEVRQQKETWKILKIGTKQFLAFRQGLEKSKQIEALDEYALDVFMSQKAGVSEADREDFKRLLSVVQRARIMGGEGKSGDEVAAEIGDKAVQAGISPEWITAFAALFTPGLSSVLRKGRQRLFDEQNKGLELNPAIRKRLDAAIEVVSRSDLRHPLENGKDDKKKPLPYDEVDAAFVAEVLKLLRAYAPKDFDRFIRTINEDGRPAVYWVQNIDEPYALIQELIEGDRAVIYFGISDKYRKVFEQAKKKSREDLAELLFLGFLKNAAWLRKEEELTTTIGRQVPVVVFEDTAEAYQHLIRKGDKNRIAGIAKTLGAPWAAEVKAWSESDIRAGENRKKKREFVESLLSILRNPKSEDAVATESAKTLREVAEAEHFEAMKDIILNPKLNAHVRLEVLESAVVLEVAGIVPELIRRGFDAFREDYRRAEWIWNSYMQKIEALSEKLKVKQDTLSRQAVFFTILWRQNKFPEAGEIEGWEQFVLSALETGNLPHIRKRAAWIAGNKRYKPSVPSLIAMLEDPDSDVRTQADSSLSEIGTPEAMFYHHLYHDDYDEAFKIAGSREMANQALKHPRASVAAAALGVKLMHPDQSEEVIMKAASKGSDETRWAATHAVGSRNLKSQLPTLIGWLQDEKQPQSVRIKAAKVTAKLADKSNFEELKLIILNEGIDEWVRLEILKTLTHLKAAAVVPDLIESAWNSFKEAQRKNNSFWNYVRTQIETLVNNVAGNQDIDSRRALFFWNLWTRKLEAAEGVLGSGEFTLDALKRNGNSALQKHAAEFAGRRKILAALQELIDLLAHLESEVAQAAAHALKELGTPKALFYMLLWNGDWLEASKIQGFQSLLPAALKHPSDSVKGNAHKLKEYSTEKDYDDLIGVLGHGGEDPKAGLSDPDSKIIAMRQLAKRFSGRREAPAESKGRSELRAKAQGKTGEPFAYEEIPSAWIMAALQRLEKENKPLFDRLSGLKVEGKEAFFWVQNLKVPYGLIQQKEDGKTIRYFGISSELKKKLVQAAKHDWKTVQQLVYLWTIKVAAWMELEPQLITTIGLEMPAGVYEKMAAVYNGYAAGERQALDNLASELGELVSLELSRLQSSQMETEQIRLRRREFVAALFAIIKSDKETRHVKQQAAESLRDVVEPEDAAEIAKILQDSSITSDLRLVLMPYLTELGAVETIPGLVRSESMAEFRGDYSSSQKVFDTKFKELLAKAAGRTDEAGRKAIFYGILWQAWTDYSFNSLKEAGAIEGWESFLTELFSEKNVHTPILQQGVVLAGVMKAANFAGALVDLMSSEDSKVRSSATKALKEIEPDKVSEHLATLLKYLGKSGGNAERSQILLILKHMNTPKSLFFFALGEGRWQEAMKIEGFQAFIEEAQKHPDAEVKKGAGKIHEFITSGDEGLIRSLQGRTEEDQKLLAITELTRRLRRQRSELREPVIFSLRAETLERLTPAQWKELIALKAIHRSELRFLISQEKHETPRLRDLRKMGDVYTEAVSASLSPKSWLIHFDDPKDAVAIRASRWTQRAFAKADFGLFDGAFGTALLYAWKDGNLPGLKRQQGFLWDPDNIYAAEFVARIFRNFEIISASA